jgi:hypothetical protein
MKEYSILFSGPMVRAILNGTKTQTRRTSDIWEKREVGSKLWIRETFYECIDNNDKINYAADGEPPTTDRRHYKKRPSIFMPRWASRITVEMVGKRREKLQDISEEDAIKEGAIFTDFGKDRWGVNQLNGWSMEGKQNSWEKCLGTARFAFANYFNKINGPGSWDLNPLVWAIEFKRI